MELMTDQIERDNQQIEIADADGKPNGKPDGHEEVVHSMGVVGGNSGRAGRVGD